MKFQKRYVCHLIFFAISLHKFTVYLTPVFSILVSFYFQFKNLAVPVTSELAQNLKDREEVSFFFLMIYLLIAKILRYLIN